MNKSYSKDIQLLMKISQNQDKIKEVLKHHNCNQNNLDANWMAFDSCAFYMSQIGEAAKLLTDKTKQSFNYINIEHTKHFRNIIDHVYEKVNRSYLKAYIFSTISNDAIKEVKNRIRYCTEKAQSKVSDFDNTDLDSKENQGYQSYEKTG